MTATADCGVLWLVRAGARCGRRLRSERWFFDSVTTAGDVCERTLARVLRRRVHGDARRVAVAAVLP